MTSRSWWPEMAPQIPPDLPRRPEPKPKPGGGGR